MKATSKRSVTVVRLALYVAVSVAVGCVVLVSARASLFCVCSVMRNCQTRVGLIGFLTSRISNIYS